MWHTQFCAIKAPTKICAPFVPCFHTTWHTHFCAIKDGRGVALLTVNNPPPPPRGKALCADAPKIGLFPPLSPPGEIFFPPPLRGVKTHSSPRWPHIPLPLAADPKPTYGRRDGFGPGFCGLGLSAGWRCADSGRCGPEKCGLTFGLLRAKFHVKNKNQTCKNTLLLLPIFQKIKNFDPIHSCFCKKN